MSHVGGPVGWLQHQPMIYRNRDNGINRGSQQCSNRGGKKMDNKCKWVMYYKKVNCLEKESRREEGHGPTSGSYKVNLATS